MRLLSSYAWRDLDTRWSRPVSMRECILAG